jgi:hypothetical protein
VLFSSACDAVSDCFWFPQSGKTDLVSFKKQIDATFGSKPERKSAGYNGESFDKTAHVEVKDGAIVLTFA